MNKPITLWMLKALNTCTGQVVLFEIIFGQEVLLTPEIIEKYHDKFDIDWLAKRILKGSARKDYEAVEGPAYGDYIETRGLALKAFRKVDGQAYKGYEEYKAARGPAVEAYEAVQGPARKKYEHTIAFTFMRIWNNE